MKVPFVDLNKQYLNLKTEIDGAIARVIENSEFVRGRDNDPFEEEFAKMIGRKHAIGCANGTDALYIAQRALGAGPGDEVITSAHTWISTSETITQTGARVVFADTDPVTFNVDAQEIERKITSQTKGVIVVHLAGQAAEVDKIKEITDRYGLWLIEDCAQAHLAEFGGKKVGTFGDIATFSFYPGKNLGAMGDAGGILTDRDDLNEWMTLFARHGGKGNHLIEGINSRLDGLQASILRIKLPHLPQWTEDRRNAAKRYDQLLSDVEGIETPVIGNNRNHVYHLYMIKVKERDQLRAKLGEVGIPSVINYSRALPFYKAYEYLNHVPEDFPNAYSNQSRILSLPIFPEITEEQQSFVVESISRCLQEIRD
jgi:dTDP-4-amino-4,6-dideoxygalactose transaminase